MPTIQQTIQKAREFTGLPEGWHFGDGVPVPQERINKAVRFLLAAHRLGLERANAFPGVGGQVEITFYDGDRMLEITIELDGSITIAEDRGQEQIYFREYCSRDDAYRRLWEFSQGICQNSSELFTINTTIQRLAVLPIEHSTLEAGSHFRWWTVSAQQMRAAAFAHISNGTTVIKLVTQPFTGQSETQSFPQRATLLLRGQLAGMSAIGTFTVGQGAPFAVLSER
jgi:hypothetical protein